MLSLVGALALIGVFLIAIFRWRQRHFSYFKNLGIPGPEPSLLWGNIREYHETHHYKVIGKWLEKYGDTFGFYDGDVPFIVTIDLDFLEYVLVRNFQNFTDRGMLTDLNKGADIYLDIVGEHADTGREANVFELYQKLTMDYVGRAAFGVDCSFQKGPENALAATTKIILRSIMKGPFHFLCQSTTTLGALTRPLYWINTLLGAYVAIAMTKETARVIDLRRKNPEFRKPDVLQSLLDAEYQEESSETEKCTSAKGKGPGMTRRLLL